MFIVDGLLHQRLFSCLNFSHASINVAKTAALIIFCSVVAVVGSLYHTSATVMPSVRKEQTAHLVRMHLCNPLHVINLHLTRH